MNKNVQKVDDDYNPKFRISLASEEYFKLRDEANSSLGNLQKVVYFTLILAGLSIPLIFAYIFSRTLLLKNIDFSIDPTACSLPPALMWLAM